MSKQAVRTPYPTFSLLYGFTVLWHVRGLEKNLYLSCKALWYDLDLLMCDIRKTLTEH